MPIPSHSDALPDRKSGAAAMRLRRHADFQTVYKLARKQYAREMSFFFARRDPATAAPSPHPPATGPRVGLTVGKVLGKAHDRNRIKRRLRAAVRQHAALLTDLPVDVVLHPKRTVLTLDWPAVENEVAQAFRTVRRLADKPQAPPPPRPPRGARKPATPVSAGVARDRAKPAPSGGKPAPTGKRQP